MGEDVRWRQRFNNFQKAFARLEEAVFWREDGALNALEKAGVVQHFEFTWELTWKVLKDYLAAEGIIEKTPRSVIKAANQAQIIDDGHVFISMLETRNLLSHRYSEEDFDAAYHDIRERFFPQLKRIHDYLATR